MLPRTTSRRWAQTARGARGRDQVGCDVASGECEAEQEATRAGEESGDADRGSSYDSDQRERWCEIAQGHGLGMPPGHFATPASVLVVLP